MQRWALTAHMSRRLHDQLDAGPASLVLSASIARRYYLDGRSKLEIAEEFGLSRFKVARADRGGAQQRAGAHRDRPQGADRRRPVGPDAGPVRPARTPSSSTPPRTPTSPLRKHLGQVAAELLAELVGPDDVLGVAWSRSVGAMARALPRLAAVPVVQLTGAITMPDGDEGSIDIVRDVARAAGGPAYVLLRAVHAARRGHGDGAAQPARGRPTLDQLPTVTKAVVGIGAWAPGQSTLVRHGPRADRGELRRLGVCAEVSGVFLAADGEPVRRS